MAKKQRKQIVKESLQEFIEETLAHNVRAFSAFSNAGVVDEPVEGKEEKYHMHFAVSHCFKSLFMDKGKVCEIYLETPMTQKDKAPRIEELKEICIASGLVPVDRYTIR